MQTDQQLLNQNANHHERMKINIMYNNVVEFLKSKGIEECSIKNDNIFKAIREFCNSFNEIAKGNKFQKFNVSLISVLNEMGYFYENGIEIIHCISHFYDKNAYFYTFQFKTTQQFQIIAYPFYFDNASKKWKNNDRVENSEIVGEIEEYTSQKFSLSIMEGLYKYAKRNQNINAMKIAENLLGNMYFKKYINLNTYYLFRYENAKNFISHYERNDNAKIKFKKYCATIVTDKISHTAFIIYYSSVKSTAEENEYNFFNEFCIHNYIYYYEEIINNNCLQWY